MNLFNQSGRSWRLTWHKQNGWLVSRIRTAYGEIWFSLFLSFSLIYMGIHCMISMHVVHTHVCRVFLGRHEEIRKNMGVLFNHALGTRSLSEMLAWWPASLSATPVSAPQPWGYKHIWPPGFSHGDWGFKLRSLMIVHQELSLSEPSPRSRIWFLLGLMGSLRNVHT